MKKIPKLSASRIVEDIVSCKWSLSVLARVKEGTCRPGALQRAIEGISTKVLNQRLSKMVRYGVLEKRNFAEIPPRVEYKLTPIGLKLVAILDQVESLQAELDRSARPGSGRASAPRTNARPLPRAR